VARWLVAHEHKAATVGRGSAAGTSDNQLRIFDRFQAPIE